jgi:hypothetical protein
MIISYNIESIIDFKYDNIYLEKFIIKMIKKTNYQAAIADDMVDSNADSDIDIYDEDFVRENVDFAKDDLIEDGKKWNRSGGKIFEI